jgi:hypothetical protein
VLKVLARDYGNRDLDAPGVPPTGGESRSARISDDEWDALRARADEDGVPATRALVALAREYIADRIKLHVHVSTSQEPLNRDHGRGA